MLEEWQRGYKFKDRLLRPAMVKVARNLTASRLGTGKAGFTRDILGLLRGGHRVSECAFDIT